MIVLVLRVNVERKCQNAITLQSCTFFVALEHLFQITVAVTRSIALGFLLDSLAFAGNEDLVWAWLLFFARLREMAGCQARVATNTELFATCLSAGVFTFSRPVALLLAFVCPTFERTSADLTAAYLSQPTWLILQNTLATQTRLGCQKSALGAWLVVLMAAVVQLRMTAILGSLALEATRRRLRTTW